MAFYQEISKYYDYIFPTEQAQVDFIEGFAGDKKSKILDIACGAGGYSEALYNRGFIIDAVDIDVGMVKEANDKFKAKNINIKVQQEDMTKLTDIYKGDYNCIFCIGNSIVHLGSLDEIGKALKEMYSLLENTGKLIIQTINYDRVIKYGVSELPPMVNDSVPLKFIRKYRRLEDKGVIAFDTILTVKNNDKEEVYENSIELLPVTVDSMYKELSKVGFNKIDCFGNFNAKKWEVEDYLSIYVAEK